LSAIIIPIILIYHINNCVKKNIYSFHPYTIVPRSVVKNIRVNEEDWIAFKRYAARYRNMAEAFASLIEVKNEKRIAGMIVERQKT